MYTVTPCVGVWIETALKQVPGITSPSHPAWVCGLKQEMVNSEVLLLGHTLRGCVDWNDYAEGIQVDVYSHTLRGCVDWNCSALSIAARAWASHPAWVCGLKLIGKKRKSVNRRHTLRGCVDWNFSNALIKRWEESHTLRGCVDWNSHSVKRFLKQQSHTLRGCVDWNLESHKEERPRARHTLRGCVDWNWDEAPIALPARESHPAWVCGLKRPQQLNSIFVPQGHTLRGCVDWNCPRFYGSSPCCVTPCVGVWIET